MQLTKPNRPLVFFSSLHARSTPCLITPCTHSLLCRFSQIAMQRLCVVSQRWDVEERHWTSATSYVEGLEFGMTPAHSPVSGTPYHESNVSKLLVEPESPSLTHYGCLVLTVRWHSLLRHPHGYSPTSPTYSPSSPGYSGKLGRFFYKSLSFSNLSTAPCLNVGIHLVEDLTLCHAWIAPALFKRQGTIRQPFCSRNFSRNLGYRELAAWPRKETEKFGFESGKGKNQRVHTTHRVKGHSPFFFINEMLFRERGWFFDLQGRKHTGKRYWFFFSLVFWR